MIIPGNSNADISQFWYPYLKKELEGVGINVIAKNMPDPDLARKEYWLPFIEEQIAGDENTILVGHSSGAVAILKYLETHKIMGAVLVGASHTDLGDEKEKASGYFDDPWQWEKIKSNAKWIIQFASVDDPYITIAEMRHIHDCLNDEYHEFSDRGHFMQDVFPELLEAVKRKL
ncbi:MAG: alpha/beta hydrolase [Candidatus Aenigmarchaeota archaeon]|nr:alpha/beta hydrolase [Candidatus Aenigmarchaeota archaeon]